MTPRRELGLAAAMCLLGSALVLVGVGRAWVVVEDGGRLTLGSLHRSVSGTAIVPGLRALGFVGLAGVLALVATRGLGRVLVGVLLAATGVTAVVLAAAHLEHARLFLEAGRAAHACAANGGPICSHPSSVRLDVLVAHGGPVWVTLLGGVVLTAAGLLTAVRGRGWAGLSSSYEAPGAAPEPAVTDKGVWDALDRGDDPTT